MNHPLASLVGPLKYACQRDFAQLGTVRDLRTLMERTLATAGAVDARALEDLRAALPHVDPPAPPEHRIHGRGGVHRVDGPGPDDHHRDGRHRGHRGRR